MSAGRRNGITVTVPATVKKLTTAIRLGSTFRLACLYAGITEETFNQWRHKYPVFSEQIKEAEGAGATTWLAAIEKAAQEGNWQAAAWKLERKYPREYGRRVIQSFEDIPPEKIPDLSDAELNELYDKLTRSN